MQMTDSINISNNVEVNGLPAFNDNYIWLIRNQRSAVVVDPGDADVVETALQELSLDLEAILITHHHPDHTGGLKQLKKSYPKATIYGPVSERIEGIEKVLHETDTIKILADLSLSVIEVPGHTMDHIAYYGRSEQNFLFCGDTLFAGGCGRLFEGSPEQMLDSLNKLASLEKDTLVYCAHEYTLANLKFALAVEPENQELISREATAQNLRANNLPTVPSTIAIEKNTNPFLRSKEAGVISAAKSVGSKDDSAVSTFAAIRGWKDRF